MTPFTIIRLVVKDFKRISAIEVEPRSKGLVAVRGRNAQGKSSVLDAIDTAIRGKSVAPGQPVRAGAERAEIDITFPDGFQIRRRFTANGGMTFKVVSNDPDQSQTQGAMDRLYRQVSVDPGEFIRLTAKEQAEQLRAAMGIDTEALDAAREDTFNERTLAGRELSRLEGAVVQMPFPDGLDQPVDVAALLREHEEGQRVIVANATVRSEAERAERTRLELAADVDAIERDLADAKQRLAGAAELSVTLQQKAGRLTDPDLDPVKAQIQNAESTNATVRARGAYREIARQRDEKRAAHDQLTADIAGIDQEKERLLAEARFPVPGVRLQGDTVTLHHVPIDQASQAERLRFATALAIALKPDMPVILIRDGSLLDDDSRQILEAMAVEAGAQIWIEEVGTEAGENGILIEDGALVGVAS